MIIPFLSFALAFGSAFSFSSTKTPKDMIEVNGKAAHCPIGNVGEECGLTVNGPVCSFQEGSTTYDAVEKSSSDCLMGQVYHKPN